MRAGPLAAFVLAGAMLFQAAPAFSHHSAVIFFDGKRVVSVKGTVKEFRWMNPHTWLFLTADDGKGGKIEWGCEGRAPGVLLRAGWNKESLVPGEMVTVEMNPAKDGSSTGMITKITKGDGRVLVNASRTAK